MKDIATVYSDGQNIILYDSDGNSMATPLNLDNSLKTVRYEDGYLVFTDQKHQEIRISTDNLVDDSLFRISSYRNNQTKSPDFPGGQTNNTILAQITAKVLGNFLQTPAGVMAIEKELNNYFNGTS